MQETQSPPLIVVADDDTETRQVMASALMADGYDVGEYDRGEALLEALAHARRPALIVADLCMPGENGLRVLRELREVGVGIPIVVITGLASEQTLNDAFRLGASVVLSKPFAVQDLRHLVACFLTPRTLPR
jgi:two-component system, NtrC family, nitrogen regulation response regulator GlnG